MKVYNKEKGIWGVAMALSTVLIDQYTDILREELLVALGCTEPIAIAYAAAIVRKTIGCIPETVEAGFSGNIIKNVKSVIVPGTGGMHGIEAAICAGFVAGCPEKELQVLSVLSEADIQRISDCLNSCRISVNEIQSCHVFDLELKAVAGEHECLIRITGNHTAVTKVMLDGKDLTASYLLSANAENQQTDRSILNVKDIITYAEQVSLEKVAPLLDRQINLNMAIAKEGLHNNYGACIGKVIFGDGNIQIKDKARAYAAAGSDARMSGCEMPVSIISGSGNQGITASVPVVVYAEAMHADHELLLRALLVSDLITIHQKTGIGCLSAYCGAISAGCGCAAGICYLNGGRYYEIAHTLVNAVAILSGTICDGAKPSCAAKIAMAVEAGIMGYDMMCAGKQFYGGEGIVTKGVENTIRNVGRLARDGMSETDKEIVRIMLGADC